MRAITMGDTITRHRFPVSGGPGFDLAQGFGKGVFCFGGIVIHLQADPESLGHAEEPGQSEAGIRSHGSLAGNDFADAPLRNPNLFGQPVLGDAESFEELLDQDFTRMRIRYFAHNLSPSMVIHDPDLYHRWWFARSRNIFSAGGSRKALRAYAAQNAGKSILWHSPAGLLIPR